MLSQVLRTRTRQHIISTFRLHLHQHFNHTLISISEEKYDSPIPVVPASVKRTALIKTHKTVKNLADAWALLRAVERKYGKVLEARFFKVSLQSDLTEALLKQRYLQDFEIQNEYIFDIHVLFLDPQSRQRISPLYGDTFYILVPIIENRPGGLGLDDVRHLLDSADIEDSFEFASTAPDPTEKVIGAKITRRMLFICPFNFLFYKREKNSNFIDNVDFYTISNPNQHKTVLDYSLTLKFFSWGGFHKLEPIEASSNIKESDCFTEPHWKQLRMRTAQRWCLEKLRRFNPDICRKLIARGSDGIVSDSSPASASMNSPESSSPTKLDIPISHESTSNSTHSRSVQTELPQPPSQSSAVTQLPPEQIPPEPTIPSAGQLTPEQKETTQKQMSKAKELKVKTKQLAAKKTQKLEKESKEEEKPKLDKSPEEPLQSQSKSIVASFWKFFGR